MTFCTNHSLSLADNCVPMHLWFSPLPDFSPGLHILGEDYCLKASLFCPPTDKIQGVSATEVSGQPKHVSKAYLFL